MCQPSFSGGARICHRQPAHPRCRIAAASSEQAPLHVLRQALAAPAGDRDDHCDRGDGVLVARILDVFALRVIEAQDVERHDGAGVAGAVAVASAMASASSRSPVTGQISLAAGNRPCRRRFRACDR
jgi:hypothetical protein